MMMASSTTRPMARISANKVSTLMEKSITPKPIKAPITDTGMVTAGIRVARRLPRKAKITAITSTTEIPRVISTSRMDARINRDSSELISR